MGHQNTCTHLTTTILQPIAGGIIKSSVNKKFQMGLLESQTMGESCTSQAAQENHSIHFQVGKQK
jgi:hypothetical protein